MEHKNKICKKCHQNPIKGILYKCSECEDYYICEKCEEMNFIDKIHLHNFIKIRKYVSKYELDGTKVQAIEIKNKVKQEENKEGLKIYKEFFNFLKRDINNNINLKPVNESNNVNQEKPKEKILYSCYYEGQGENFIFNINQHINFKISISNNGEKNWIENKTYIQLENNESFKCEKIKLSPLKKGEIMEIEINLEKTRKKKMRDNLKFKFYVEEECYGQFEIPIQII